MAMIDRNHVAFRGLRLIGAVVSFLPPLLTRLVIGFGFYQAGSGKLADISKPIGFFTDLGIPAPVFHAHLVSRLECYGGLLLMIGLATRPFALLLGGTMAVALMTAHREEFFGAFGSGKDGLTDIVPVMWGMFLLWLAVYGPGFVSVDRLIAFLTGYDREPLPRSAVPVVAEEVPVRTEPRQA